MPTIRPYTPDDRAAALDLVIAVWAPVFVGMRAALPAYVYDSFYPEGWEARQRSDIGALLDAASDAQPAWIAEDEGAIAGLLIAAAHEGDSMGEVVLIGTHPDHQRRGIAKALTEEALSWMQARGLTFAMTETGADEGHAPARSAYEALGFEPWRIVRYVKKL